MKMLPNISGSGGGGGKGGGGGGRAPVEAPNTLRSRATARVVDLIGEGPNVGLLDGAKSIKFDGTRLQNDDGSFNFTGVSWDQRLGYPDQNYMPGFSEIESETGVGVELTNEATYYQPNQPVNIGVPFVQDVTGTAQDCVIVVSLPQGISQPRYTGYGTYGNAPYGVYGPYTTAGVYIPPGAKDPASVSYAIDVLPSGGVWTQVIVDTVSGLFTTEVQRQYGVPLIGVGPWRVRVRRITGAQTPGTLDQINFFSITFSASAPAIRTVNNLDATSARLTARLPSGLFTQNTENGDINPYQVGVAIDVRPQGGYWRNAIVDVISGKTTTPYERSYRVPLAAFGPGPWDIRMRRTTKSNNGVNFTSSLYWSSFTTIVDDKIRYSDSHVIGIAVDADSFGGNIPSRSYHVRGRIVQVPTSYDPETRTDSGDWNGSFKLAWTNNPAWCVYDMIMHRRYGMGEFVEDLGLKWDLYQIQQYCDGLVPDGNGGMEPRFTFNGIFQTDEEAVRVIQAMCSVFRGMSWWGSGGIAVSADMPADSKKLVSPANVVGGEFKMAGTALKARHTVIMVQWNDPLDGFRLNIEMVEDPEGIDRYGWRPLAITAFGCTSQGQANRVGKWILDSEKFETQSISYTASFDHADVRPGELISVSDPAFSNVRRAGRIVQAIANGDGDYDQILVDAPETLQSGINYTLNITMPDGSLYSSAMLNGPGSTDTFLLASPPPIPPNANAMWALTGDDVEPRLFRVLAVKESANNLFEIAGIFHDPTKYARVEQNFTIEPPIYSTVQTGPIGTPTNLTIAEYLFLSGNVTARSAVTFSWTAPNDARVQYYEVQYRPQGDNWQGSQVSQSISIDLLDFGSGTFDFRVRALDGAGKPSPWVEIAGIQILGLLAPPDDVTGFRISILNDVATLTWNPVANLNRSHYVIMFSPDLVATWNSGLLLLDNITTTSVQVPAMIGTYMIKAQTVQGQRSLNAKLIVNEVANHNQFNAVELLAEQPDFPGVLDGVIVNSDYDGLQLGAASDFFDQADFFENPDFFLQTEGFLAEGYYYFESIIDLTEVLTSRLSAVIEAFGVNFSASFFDVPDFFDPPDFFKVPGDKWGVELQFVATDIDPSLDPNFDPVNNATAPWQQVIIGDYTARAYRFRARLWATDFGISPVVPRLEVLLDMPDRIVSDNDLTVGLTGRRVDFMPPYRALKGLGIAGQGLNTGDYYEITNKDEFGFDIIFKDASHAAVVRSFDFVANGYGRVQ